MSIAIVQNGIRLATSWEDVRLNLFGNPIAGVTAISYSESQEKQNFWGAGNEPQERGYGNKTYEASITLTAQTVQRWAGGGRAGADPRQDFLVPRADEGLRSRRRGLRYKLCIQNSGLGIGA
jgi:hypothetical protein